MLDSGATLAPLCVTCQQPIDKMSNMADKTRMPVRVDPPLARDVARIAKREMLSRNRWLERVIAAAVREWKEKARERL